MRCTSIIMYHSQQRVVGFVDFAFRVQRLFVLNVLLIHISSRQSFAVFVAPLMWPCVPVSAAAFVCFSCRSITRPPTYSLHPQCARSWDACSGCETMTTDPRPRDSYVGNGVLMHTVLLVCSHTLLSFALRARKPYRYCVHISLPFEICTMSKLSRKQTPPG